MEPDRKQLADLARLVANTAAEELDCEVVLDGLAPLLERRQNGDGLDAELERVRQHLSVCPECLEEFDALAAAFEEPGDDQVSRDSE